MESETLKVEISEAVITDNGQVVENNEAVEIEINIEDKSEKIEKENEPSDKNLHHEMESKVDKEPAKIQNENKECAEQQIESCLTKPKNDLEAKEIPSQPDSVTSKAIVVADSINNSSLGLLNQYFSSSEYESDDSDQESEKITGKGSAPCKTTEKITIDDDDDVIVLEKIQEHITNGPYRIASSSSEEERYIKLKSNTYFIP